MKLYGQNVYPASLLIASYTEIEMQTVVGFQFQRKFENGKSFPYPLSGSLQLPYNPAPRAIFCRLEEKNFKSSRLALKLRLGDFSYANYLEGKQPVHSMYNN